MYIEQTENYWDYLREIVLPGYRSSANTWKGAWIGNMTSGPGALSTAKVTGGSGEFAGMDMLGVESLSVRAWRVDGDVFAVPEAADLDHYSWYHQRAVSGGGCLAGTCVSVPRHRRAA